jgi:RND superfamily putative drug exporter
MTVVPAVMALLGDRAWAIPPWLDRLLPNFDIEGEGVADQAPAAPAAAADGDGDGGPPEQRPAPADRSREKVG